MNIDALLSPSDTASSGKNSPTPSMPSSEATPPLPQVHTAPASGKRMPSGLSHEFVPDARNAHLTLPAFRLENRGSHGSGASAARPVAPRSTSTSHPDSLLDTHRRPGSRSHSSDKVHLSTESIPRGSVSALPPSQAALTASTRRGSTHPTLDFIMAEASASTPEPRSVESSSLSQAESKEVTDLLSYLADHSFAYESHARLVALLHQGFLSHVCTRGDSSVEAFPLLSELRQAREAMDTRFAVGETIWLDWLSDEMLLATSSEERINVTELCQRAVQDEPASVQLWRTYADWIESSYAACHGLMEVDPAKWSAEDKEVCRDLFTRDMLLNVLEQAAEATQWLVDASAVMWDRYAEVLLEDLPPSPAAKDVERVSTIFLQRLQVPHAGWSETKNLFWKLVSTHGGDGWEAIMDEANRRAAPAQKQMNQRDPFEQNLRNYIASGERDAEANEWSQYLQWEKKQSGKARAAVPFELRCALYERALLRFPTYHDWWIDYVDLVTSLQSQIPKLPLIERATRHCPWSGDLWARRILRSDVEGKPREEIEATKHRATNSGLLDVGGMEELLKVLQQWCSYLRRYAFSREGAEDDRDVAELGITAALDDIQQAGRKLYGEDFHGDPFYRLEKIHIKFLGEARRFDEARAIYRALVPLQKNTSDFWYNYYGWELWQWAWLRLSETHRIETTTNGPDLATAVLQEALSQRNLDYPERILDMYTNHFQQHESNERLQAALIDAREFSKQLAIRRAKEAEEAAQAAAQQVQTTTADVHHNESVANGEKRKRDDDPSVSVHESKKAKTELTGESGLEIGEPSASASGQIKRDREHNTITLKDLPVDVTELDVKKFFREVGVPLTINILPDPAGELATATVEFETHDDVLAAKTRSGKQLNGHEVRIQSGTQSTLYVANYPAEYDEAAVRKLFDSYGEVVSVRFPSLKFNSRRRFCYVQFLTTDMAKAAAGAMDNKILDGQHRLLARISDPDAKKQRSGAQAEGRELFVKNLERSAPEHEIKQFFEDYGTVVSMNLVKLVNGKRTGTAFVVFSNPEEASAALDADSKPFHDRILHVELSSSKARAAPSDRAKKEDINIRQGTSASPEPGDASNGARRGSNTSMAAASAGAGADDSWKTARERKIAIFDLPDTVNDARLRAAMQAYGPVLKIQLRRGDRGAIVEFAAVRDAFNVRQGVDCSALGPDVRTGDVADLLASVRKRQAAASPAEADAEPTESSSLSSASRALLPPSVSRPAQRGVGRRGGLGVRRGGAGVGATRPAEGGPTEAPTTPAAENGKAAKSNAQFRHLFEQSRAPQPKE